MASINRGDNTKAFGFDFLRIYLNNPNNLKITKAVFQINGQLEKEFINPEFPLRVNFSGQETELLCQVNICKLALWDEAGRRRTADGKFTFFVKENCIKSPDTPDESVIDNGTIENSITFDLSDTEFAAQFVINATPSRMSELEQDIYLMKPENIKGGKNIQTHVEGDDVIIDAIADVSVSYKNVTDKPSINGQLLEGDITVECQQVNADWNAEDGKALILNKPELSNVATSGLYSDLVDAPNVPTKLSELENDENFIKEEVLENYYDKTEVDEKIEKETGNYNTKLQQKIEDVQVQEEQDVININKTIDENKQELNEKIDNEVNVLNSKLAKKADTDYVNEQLNNKLNNGELGQGTLTINKNNVSVGTFNANSKEDVSINIQVPTKVSDLENDSSFVDNKAIEELKQEINIDNYVDKNTYENEKNDFVKHNELGHGILTIKANNNVLNSFNANTNNLVDVNIEIPTKLSELEKDIEILTSNDLTDLNDSINDLKSVTDNIPTQLSELQDQIDTKVDKEPGKQLIDKSEIERLSKLKDYDDTELRESINTNTQDITNLKQTVQNKVDQEVGKKLSSNDYTDEDKAKLDNIDNNNKVLDTTVQSLKSQVEQNTQALEDLQGAETNVNDLMQKEKEQREQKDNELQSQIEALNAKSNVVDIVASKQELDDYDISNLKDKDVVCVLKDETQNETMSYYRFQGVTFLFIGSVAETYTKSETDDKFVPKTRTINKKDLSDNITLTAEDVKALPDTTLISNATITIQKNGAEDQSFTLNQEEAKTINLNIPTKTSDLTNDNEFVNSEYLKKYIGDVQEDDNLQDQVDVLRDSIASNKNKIDSLESIITGETSSLPTVALTGRYSDLEGLPQKLSDISKNNKIDPNNTEYIDTKFINTLKEKTGYLTIDDINLEFAEKTEIPTNLSQLENDRGFVTSDAIGRGILTIQINGQNFEGNKRDSNEHENQIIDIPVDHELNDKSVLPVENKVITAKITEINDSSVHIEGTETIKGDKTFTGNVSLSNATGITMDNEDSSSNLATTKFVKNQDYCTNTDAVHKTGEETISGNKTFTGNVDISGKVTLTGESIGVTVPSDDNSKKLATTAFVKSLKYATDSQTVHITGDEEINGDKTFNDTTKFVGITQLGQYAHVATPDKSSLENWSEDLVVNVEYVDKQIQLETTSIQEKVDSIMDNVPSKDYVDIVNAGTIILEPDRYYCLKIVKLATDEETKIQYTEQLETLQSTLEELDVTNLNVDNTETEISTITSTMETIDADIQTCKEQSKDTEAVEASSAQIRELLDTLNTDVSNCKNQIEEAKTNYTTIGENIQTAIGEVETLSKKQEPEFNERLSTIETNIQSLSTSITDINGQIETFGTSITDINGQIETLQSDIETLKGTGE